MNIIYYSYMLTVFINFVIIQMRTKWRMDYVMRRLNNIDLQLSDIRTSVKDMSQQEDEFRQTMMEKMEAEMTEQRRFRENVMTFITAYNNQSSTHSYSGPSYEVIQLSSLSSYTFLLVNI